VGVACLGYTCPEVVHAMTAQAERLPYAHALRFDTGPLLDRHPQALAVRRCPAGADPAADQLSDADHR
jgi:adenosylmethionine-8-amino-7-oxononanoate aminotransferase